MSSLFEMFYTALYYTAFIVFLFLCLVGAPAPNLDSSSFTKFARIQNLQSKFSIN